jgi:hypothetical protein
LEYDTSEELIGENWFDIPSEINAQVKQAYSKVMSGEMEEKSIITKMRLLQGNKKVNLLE